jgi:hypothetical protein
MNHTQGRWTVQGQFVGTEDCHVAQVKGEGRGITAEQAAANARLIAAAPDLLEALIDAASTQPADSTIKWVLWSRAAIAKATGG